MNIKRDTKSILIIGMARSGTTLVSRLLADMPDVSLEMEPTILWKSGNFHHLADNRFDIRPDVVAWIRHSFLTRAAGRHLVEKTPANSVRPHLVHAVFPDAKIVYVERDPVRCIHSNVAKTLLEESFKPSILSEKFVLGARAGQNGKGGSAMLRQPLKANGGRRFHEQLRVQDILQLTTHVIRMSYIRSVLHAVPFGPKVGDFVATIRDRGPIAYHVQVYREAQKCKRVFEDLYGTELACFKLERFYESQDELMRLYDFCGFAPRSDQVAKTFNGFNPEILRNAQRTSAYDHEIVELLNAV